MGWWKIIKNSKTACWRSLQNYVRDNAASIMLTFGLSLPVVIASVGMALDLGQAYLVRQRLAAALDAAALAGAAMATEEDEIREKVEEFFAMNYPDDKIGRTFDLSVDLDGEEVVVRASARFDTMFMRVIGVNDFTVSESAIVVREVRGLEVVLVLDVTGSMAGQNIRSLREAATNFVEILFERTSDPEAIKIGIVPYATSVNVGPYGVGLTPDGDDFEDGDDFGEIFVVDENGDFIDPDRYTTNANASIYSSRNWLGCVVEKNDDGWDEDYNDNDPYPNDTIDHTGPWPIYAYETYGRNETYCGRDWRGRALSCYYPHYYPNYICPTAHIVPLTSDEEELLDAIEGLQASGNTMGNVGMVWGYRVISPGAPFQQGAAFDDPEWRKVVVMMTDGMNTMDNSYSAFWRTRNHNLRTQDQNERFVETCDNMKAPDGILIYTITFEGGVDNNTKDYYRDCATTPSQYYDAPSQDDLVDVFEKISRELANLHLRN